MLPAWLPSDPVLEATKAPYVEALSGELLREWASSEVWRMSYGLRSVVVKHGTDTQSGEAAAYQRLVIPLGLPAPRLLYAGDEVLVLEDVGRVTLEQEPTADGFLAAAEVAADIHGRAVSGRSE